jgi:hypothetical protein
MAHRDHPANDGTLGEAPDGRSAAASHALRRFHPLRKYPGQGCYRFPVLGTTQQTPRQVREISHLAGFVQQTPNPYTMKGFSPQQTRVLVLIAALLDDLHTRQEVTHDRTT